MAVCTSCPDRARLRDLLDGVLPDDEQARLTEHLDSCTDCQGRLEDLAAGAGSWTGPLPWQGYRPAGIESALRGAMAELRGGSSDPTRDEDEVAESADRLDFLDPPEGAESMGRFGPYDVREVVGRGGMGVVLKGFDPDLHRFVAIKVLAPQLATSAAARRRFAREAKAAAAVSHEHVVAIHAVASAGGLPYLVMELVPGVSLQQRLDRDGPLALEEILRIGMQTAEGLAAAHAQGLVHRDVKPANILLENGVERVRLTDFGLARAIDDASMTQSGLLAGTPQYMAPEQARGEPVDHRSDLFSLGSVLYAMCTGRPPFRASTTLAVLRRVSDDTPRPVQEINPQIPSYLVEIMNRLLAKDPARRFASAAEVSRLLGHHLARLQQPPPPAPPRRRRWPLAAALGLILAMLAVATVLRVRTPEGTLVIEVSDPNVKVTVDGSEVIINGAGVGEVRLRAGAHQVKATRDGSTVHDALIHITRDGKEVVKVTLEPAGKAGSAIGRKGPRNYHTHAGAVRELVFSPDGMLMAVAGGKVVHLLEAATGRVRAVLKGFAGGVVSVAFFPDGKVLVTVSDDGAVKLWDVVTGKELASLKVAAGIRASSMQPQGKVLATGVDDTVRLWDTTTGKSLGVWLEHDKPVASVAFSPDGKRLVTSAEGGCVRVWDVASGKPQGIKILWASEAKSLAFSPDGKRLAAAGPRGRVVIWDAATGKEIREFTGQKEPAVVAFSPAGRILAVAADKGVTIWDVRTGKALGTLPGREGTTTRLTFGPDGKRLAAGNTDGLVQVWDLPAALARGDKAESLLPPDVLREEVRLREMAEELALEAHGLEARARLDGATTSRTAQRLLYLAHVNMAVVAWRNRDAAKAAKLLEGCPKALRGWEWHYLKRLQAGAKELVLGGHADKVFVVAFSPDGKLLASVGGDNRILLQNPATGKTLRKLEFPKHVVTALAFSPDGKWLASGGPTHLIDLWELPAGKPAYGVEVNRKGVSRLAFSPDGKRLAAACGDGTVKVWVLALNGVFLVRNLKGHTGAVRAVAFSPDGKLLASGSDKGSVRLWDVSSGKEVRRLLGDKNGVRGLAFSPDGKLLATCDGDGRVRVWDPATGKELHTLRGHTGNVNAVVFSPDGRRLVSAGADKVIKVWDAATGKEVLTLRGHRGAVNGLAFSPDGRLLASGSDDETVRVWSGVPVP